MSEQLIVDASIAVKWLIAESDSKAAVALRGRFAFVAPDLLGPECANILWKKVARGELTGDEAHFAARLLSRSDVELIPTRRLIAPATDLAVRLGHPAYDCIYLALASERRIRFVTVDRQLLHRVRSSAGTTVSDLCVHLDQLQPGGELPT